MAGLTEFYCGSNEPSHASQFKWLEYTFNRVYTQLFVFLYLYYKLHLKVSCTAKNRK